MDHIICHHIAHSTALHFNFCTSAFLDRYKIHCIPTRNQHMAIWTNRIRLRLQQTKVWIHCRSNYPLHCSFNFLQFILLNFIHFTNITTNTHSHPPNGRQYGNKYTQWSMEESSHSIPTAPIVSNLSFWNISCHSNVLFCFCLYILCDFAHINAANYKQFAVSFQNDQINFNPPHLSLYCIHSAIHYLRYLFLCSIPAILWNLVTLSIAFMAISNSKEISALSTIIPSNG